jgi:purine-nucleoside phosphorylase
MDHLESRLDAAVARWDQSGLPRPKVAVVAGSGLGVDLGGRHGQPIAFSELFGADAHAIVGHDLRVECLRGGGAPVIYFRGRIHGYQGHTPAEVVFQARLAALLGCKVLLLTNAAGSLRRHLLPGSLVLLEDHLNLTGRTPLEGNPPAAWGPRFPDMSEAYSRRLADLALGHANRLGIPVQRGVYAGLLGPSYETPAEVRMLGTLGADLVGMSTVLEVIAARHMGLECAAISLVTNLGTGLGAEPLDHQEVLDVGREATGRLAALLAAVASDPALVS